MIHQEHLPALIVAREDEALRHGQVMYGLIKPTKDMEQIESTAAMVNVIPKKRIYRMETRDEIDLFMKELMKRPLVIQPSAYIGRGLAMFGCTFYTQEERWIILVNQSHPKIRSWIIKSIDTVKAKMDNGEPFILEISFNEFLKGVYFEKMTLAPLNRRLTFIEFVDAEIVIRYPGDIIHRSRQWKNKPIRFKIDNILNGEVKLRTVADAEMECRDPALRVIMPAKLKILLPGWEFENIDPFAQVAEASDEEYSEEEGAVACISFPQMEAQPSGRIVGRAMRKANNYSSKYDIPVELHIPEEDETEFVNRNLTSPQSASWRSPGSPSGSRSIYEQLVRSSGSCPNSQESQYDKLQVETHPQYFPSSVSSSCAPDAHLSSQYLDQDTARNHRSPISSNTQQSPHGALTPNMSHSKGQASLLKNPDTQVPPPLSAVNNADRYNTEHVNNTRLSHKTYLTDDKNDGRFSIQAQSSRTDNTRSRNAYDNNSIVVDRHLAASPKDPYYEPKHPVGKTVTNNIFHLSEEESVSPSKGLHWHQGSGKSDTSTSDSGFGENDLGFDSLKLRTDRQNCGVKTNMPYYNHAFEDDLPDCHDDVLPRHKALASMMLQHNSSHSNRPAYQSDLKYQLNQLQKNKHEHNEVNDHVVESFKC